MVHTAPFWILLASGVPAYWLLPRRIRAGFLAAISAGFLLTVAAESVLVLALQGLLYFHLAPLGAKRRGIVPGLVLLSLGYLAFHKYLPPLLRLSTGAFDAASPGLVRDLGLPLGISYFTFKLIHYGIERSRGNLPPHSLPLFFCYLYLFPVFSAGPIERFEHLVAGAAERPDREMFAEGLTRIVHGLVKKFAVAELFLAPAMARALEGTAATDLAAPSLWRLLALMFAYAYLDFSACSDLAIGASRLFGFRIMENFGFPFLARSIGEFWSRWHMTLSNWCRTYAYLPTLGLTRSPYLAAYACFLVMGLWHAGTPGWLLWGLFQGTGVAVFQSWRVYRRRKGWRGMERFPWSVLGIALTLAFFSASFVFTAACFGGGLGVRFRLLGRLVGLPV